MADVKLTKFQRKVLAFAAREGAVYGQHGKQTSAQILGTNQPGLSKAVNRLRDRGLLTNTYYAEITEAGREAVAA